MARSGDNHKGGRPKGYRAEATKIKDKAKADFKVRVAKMSKKLLNAQASLALGVQILIRVDEVTKTVKGKIVTTREHNVVTASYEIAKALEEFDGSESGMVDDNYYYITTEKPNNQAIDSLYNRAWGRPTESVEMSGPDGAPMLIKLNE